jgi:ABC-type cobalamin/Fe3+-siderophores transport system ATPase subunit
LLDKGIIVASGAPDEVLDDARIAEVFGVRAERATTDTGERTLIFKR